MKLPPALLLAVAALATAKPVDLHHTTLAHISLNHQAVGSDFVSVSNGTFYQKGKPTYLVSMNYWAALNLAASDEAGGNISRFETEMEQMAAKGINNLRIVCYLFQPRTSQYLDHHFTPWQMASSEASQLGVQPFRMYPALMTAPGVYNEEIFVGLDRTLAKMANLSMTAVMTLNNFWHWSGGISQYVSWADNLNVTIPYPPSWDPTLNPPFGDYSTNGSWGSYLGNSTYSGFPGYAGRFYNDSSISNLTNTWWRAHINTVANRRNTFNGRIYKEDPTIMTWELMNEPQDPPLSWVVDTADYIKQIAPKQLVTVGFEGKQGEWWYKRVHSPASVDYGCAHLWVQNWGYYDPTVSNASSLGTALNFANEFLTNVSRWSLDIGKPVVLEEFGMARDEWENVERGAPTEFYLYDASAGTTHKDTYFTYVLDLVLAFWKSGKAFAGAGPWAYGGIWRPFNARNQFNELWAGDPPHEAPGWYDLYDSDYAMEIVKNQADVAAAHIATL
ncbi:mannan endo-1,4-beta-mannosidase, partial [Phenoliferia sp. Uapishka_3]